MSGGTNESTAGEYISMRRRPTLTLLLWLGAAAAARAQAVPPPAAAEEEEVSSFYVDGDPKLGMDCTAVVETLGCFEDAKYKMTVGRDLPYNIPGCFSGDPPSYSKTAPNPPLCTDSLMTNAYCAKLCLDWSLHIPDAVGSTTMASGDIFAATQAGFACFCGLIDETEKVIELQEKAKPTTKYPLNSCSDACKGDPSGSQATLKGGYKTCGG